MPTMDRRLFLQRTGILTETQPDHTHELERLRAMTTKSGSTRGVLATDLTPWSPQAGEWSTHTIGHLYRRVGFGATQAEIASALASNPNSVIDDMLSDEWTASGNLPQPPMNADHPDYGWRTKAPYIGNDLQEQIK